MRSSPVHGERGMPVSVRVAVSMSKNRRRLSFGVGGDMLMDVPCIGDGCVGMVMRGCGCRGVAMMAVVRSSWRREQSCMDMYVFSAAMHVVESLYLRLSEKTEKCREEYDRDSSEEGVMN